jgi:hypothetical protein
MSSSQGPNIVGNGLIFYIDAANIKSVTNPVTPSSWKDLAVQGGDLSLSPKTPFYTGGTAANFSFNGSNQYAYAANGTAPANGILSQQSSVTVEIVMSSTATQSISNGTVIFAKASNNTLSDGFGFYRDSGGLSFYVTTSSLSVSAPFGPAIYVQQPLVSTATIPLTHYCAVVPHNGNLQLYVNGILSYVGSAFNNNSLGIKDPSFVFVGAVGPNTSPSDYSTCTFYEAKIYERALSSDEVFQNFEATRGRYGL